MTSRVTTNITPANWEHFSDKNSDLFLVASMNMKPPEYVVQLVYSDPDPAEEMNL